MLCKGQADTDTWVPVLLPKKCMEQKSIMLHMGRPYKLHAHFVAEHGSLLLHNAHACCTHTSCVIQGHNC